MPTQELHVIVHPTQPELPPWYSTRFGEELITPDWTFRRSDLYRCSEE